MLKLTFIFIVTLISTFTTFLTFINKSFVTLNENNVFIGNSSNIANAASDLVVNTQGAAFGLVFSGDATTGWTYTEK